MDTKAAGKGTAAKNADAPTAEPVADAPEEAAPVAVDLASEALDNADDLFKRGRKANPSKHQPDVQASLNDGKTRRIAAADEDSSRVIVNSLRKAARELGCSLQVKFVDGYVVFRAKPKPVTVMPGTPAPVAVSA